MVAATSSSRFTVPNYWPDPKSGIGYQVQVQIPQRLTTSLAEIETIPVSKGRGPSMLLRDVATVTNGKMKQLFHSDANAANDLGTFAKYATPVVANGKVYVATFSKKVVQYGL